jgi:D-methionine transport system ATP-binding protein
MIVARNINKSFSGFKVLRGVNLHIKKGDIYALAGRSGAGKSTFLRCVNGLEPYDEGDLIVHGVNPKKLPEKDLRAFRKNIGMIFQNFSLLERLTVYDNVALPLRCWKHRASYIDRKVRELLGLVGLADKIRQRPRTLSGGQKQRVAIARALSLEPEILLCDEATSALDPKTSQEIIALLRRINNRMGITIVMVTHQMSVLSSACDEVAILEDGRVEIKGPVKHIFRQQPLALKNLLGENYNDPIHELKRAG